MSMSQVLDKIILDSEEGAAEVQISLKNGVPMAGAVTKTDIEDVYEILAVGQEQIRGGQEVFIKFYFTGASCFSVSVRADPSSEQPQIVSPHRAAPRGMA